MQLKLPFRLTRGVTVLLAIVFAHLMIAAWFIGMQVKAPEIGPVFATIFLEPPASEARQPEAAEHHRVPVEVKAEPGEEIARSSAE